MLLCVLLDEGDEVIIPAPYWVSYAELVKLAQGKNIILPTTLDTNYKITASPVGKSYYFKNQGAASLFAFQPYWQPL